MKPAFQLFVLLFLCAWVVRAQVTTATLTGIVTDPTGAVVPGAKVNVIHSDTNLERSTVTDSSGGYTIPALKPGTYRVEVEQPGFKKAELTGIVLQVNQTARMDIRLTPGTITETITVTSTTPLLNTENPMIGGVITGREVLNLPLNGRNFMELTTLTGGVNPAGNSTAKAGILNKGFAPSAAGMPGAENNYQLDGADNKEPFFNTFSISPSVDAIQEFKMQVGQYSAEFGSGGGAVVNVVTRSGGNEWHGTAFEFLRNDVLDSRNFFSPRVPALRRNQFGGSLGGPVKKNKAFFFANYDGTRERRGLTGTALVPTDAQRNGDLSAFGKTIKDPFTGQPFPGAVIPSERIDPISKAVIKEFYPVPNASFGPGINFIRNPPKNEDDDNVLARGDYNISEKHRLMVRYGWQGMNRTTGGTLPNLGGQIQPQHFQNAALSVTSSLTAHVLNEFHFSYGRTWNGTVGQNTGNPVAEQLGIQLFAGTVPATKGAPQAINLSSTRITQLFEGQPWYLTVNSFQWYDGVTWAHEAHTFKAGADWKRPRIKAWPLTHVNGNWNFTGAFTGDGFADFLLGLPSFLQGQLVTPASQYYTWNQMAYYVLDDWKPNPKLTLSLGLRYEYNSPPVEQTGITPYFDRSLGGGTGGMVFPAQNRTVTGPYSANYFYTVVRPDLPFAFADTNSPFLPDKNNFAPRFGLAYRPFATTRTVIRGGYGFYYSSPTMGNIVNNMTAAPPGQYQGGFGTTNINDGLTWNGLVGVDPKQFFKNAFFGALTGPERHFLFAYTQQWSLSIGHELTRNLGLDIQYLGSKTTHLENLMAYNMNPVPQPLGTFLQPLLPHPKWGNLYGFSSGANANYNALMLSAERRVGQGLSFHAAYTYGKALASYGALNTSGFIGRVQGPYNSRGEIGPTADDVTHRFTYAYVYDLPFGSRRRFGSGLTGPASALVSGWRVAGITTFQTGLPLFMNVSNINCGTNNAICRPDLIGNVSRTGNGVDVPMYNRNAFDWPINNPNHPNQQPRLGNVQPNLLRGNGLNLWNVALEKDIRVSDRVRSEFRWELFNVWNHPNFGDPVADPTNPNFGRAFSALEPRDMQFGLKVYW